MSSEKFESLKEDVYSLCQSVQANIEKTAAGQERNKKREVANMERNIDEITILLQEMEFEAKSAPTQYQQVMLKEVKSFRDQVYKFSQDIRAILSQRNTRQQFFGEEDDSTKTRQTVLKGTKVLHETTDSLMRSHQVAAETEAVGSEVIEDLTVQRESLLRTQGHLSGTDHELKRSRNILRSMGRKAITNKLVLVIIIVIEIAILVALVYWKFIM